MSQNSLNSKSMRLAFLGHSCAASAATLSVLLGAIPSASSTTQQRAFQPVPTIPVAHGHEIVSIILAGSPGEGPGEPERLAAEAGIPVVWVPSVTESISALRDAAPVVAIAACFPWRLPRAAREIPPLGILNVHPSLLPAGRGPEPVFWTLRRGEPVTGATVHRMDAGFDTGPIVAQAEMPVPLDVRAPDLENALMAVGGRLVREVLPELAAGTLEPQPQPVDGVTHAPVPSPADWTMVSSLPAAWAWRFARGVAPLGGPLTVIAGGAAIAVADALDWQPDERLEQSVIDEGDGIVRVRFSPGWVRFRRS